LNWRDNAAPAIKFHGPERETGVNQVGMKKIELKKIRTNIAPHQ
jgi:hypothetical protein